jgi:hypothetical protein
MGQVDLRSREIKQTEINLASCPPQAFSRHSPSVTQRTRQNLLRVPGEPRYHVSRKRQFGEYFPNSGISQVAIDLWLSRRTILRTNFEFVVHRQWNADESKLQESVAKTVGRLPRGSINMLCAVHSESANTLRESERHRHSLFLSLPGRCRPLVLTM